MIVRNVSILAPFPLAFECLVALVQMSLKAMFRCLKHIPHSLFAAAEMTLAFDNNFS